MKTMKKTLPANRDAQAWADRVNKRMAASVAAVIEVGRELAAARAALEHGEWSRMFAGVERPVQFSMNTANRLIAVAKHPVLSNGAHGHRLPSSWRTLYELTKLSEPVLLVAISGGRVHADMERQDVAELREEVQSSDKRKKEASRVVKTPDDRERCLITANEIVIAGYRSLAKERHPDTGGNHDAMTHLTFVKEWLLQMISTGGTRQ